MSELNSYLIECARAYQEKQKIPVHVTQKTDIDLNCKFCRKDKEQTDLFKNDVSSVYVTWQNALVFEHYEIPICGIDIKYCPSCGRKL